METSRFMDDFVMLPDMVLAEGRPGSEQGDLTVKLALEMMETMRESETPPVASDDGQYEGYLLFLDADHIHEESFGDIRFARVQGYLGLYSPALKMFVFTDLTGYGSSG
jgi:hypothetical protein